MTFGQFRMIPKHEQIEMIAHRREYHWREQHSEKIRQSVAKERAREEAENKKR